MEHDRLVMATLITAAPERSPAQPSVWQRMRGYLWSLLLLGSVLLTSGCVVAVPPAKVKPLSKTVKAEHPVWQVGDLWRFRGLLSGAVRIDKFIRRDESMLVFLDQGVEGYYLDLAEAFALKKVDHRIAVEEFNPPLEYYRWPLEVGKHWTVESEVSRGPQLGRLRGEVAVETYEEITVPAGTFEAFKLRARFKLSAPLDHGAEEVVVWYAPAVRYRVRIEFYPTRGGAWELESFELVAER
jgi:hypothetical protein